VNGQMLACKAGHNRRSFDLLFSSMCKRSPGLFLGAVGCRLSVVQCGFELSGVHGRREIITVRGQSYVSRLPKY
jgi:hypothetical protein